MHIKGAAAFYEWNSPSGARAMDHHAIGSRRPQTSPAGGGVVAARAPRRVSHRQGGLSAITRSLSPRPRQLHCRALAAGAAPATTASAAPRARWAPLAPCCSPSQAASQPARVSTNLRRGQQLPRRRKAVLPSLPASVWLRRQRPYASPGHQAGTGRVSLSPAAGQPSWVLAFTPRRASKQPGWLRRASVFRPGLLAEKATPNLPPPPAQNSPPPIILTVP